MPTLLGDRAIVGVGDVLMIKRVMADKDTGKPYDWRYLMVVTELKQRGLHIAGLRLGAEEGRDMVYLYLPSHERRGIEAHWLAPEEWPDGVHAFRMKLILEGRIEGLI